MIPGEVFPAPGTLTLNEGRSAITLRVANTGDRPVQVGSHYHFAEANSALTFDRDAARGRRLEARARTGDSGSLVEVRWTTLLEDGTRSFAIERSDVRAGPYELASGPTTARGPGHEYVVIDDRPGAVEYRWRME